MLVVQESGNWGRLIKSLYGQEFSLQVVSPAEWGRLRPGSSRYLLVQFCEPCIDMWLSLFDKTGLRLENLGTALLNAPTGKIERSWCQELGFHHFVDDMESLDRVISRWKYDLSAPSRFSNLSEEMMQRIPWS